MTIEELRRAVLGNVFSYLDVEKFFGGESSQTIRTQLSRFTKRGLVQKIKRGWYCFDSGGVDELELASRLYQPSYISLETALNYYGLIPDVPQGVTGITVTATKKMATPFGRFYYTKIKPDLFWGFKRVGSFSMAKREKALLDYFYIRKIKNVQDLRLSLGEIDRKLYGEYAKSFPAWVQNIKL